MKAVLVRRNSKNGRGKWGIKNTIRRGLPNAADGIFLSRVEKGDFYSFTTSKSAKTLSKRSRASSTTSSVSAMLV